MALQQFYYNEILHYFEKSTFIFNIILLRKNVYIDNENNLEFDSIKPYRVNNFIDISNSILGFLLSYSKKNKNSHELNNDILKLEEQVKEFNKIWNE